MCSYDPTKLLVRPALMSDYDDVMAIGEMYNGFDYLVAKYETFAKDPDIYPYVAVYLGEVVGYLCYEIINGGSAQLKISWRIKPAYQHKGLGSQLSVKACAALQRVRPGKREQWCVVAGAHHVTGYDVMHTWSDVRTTCLASSISQQLPPSVHNIPIHRLSPAKALSILADKRSTQRLFGTNAVMVTDCLKPTLLNRHRFQEIVSRTSMYASYAKCNNDSEGRITGLSYHIIYRIHAGYRFDIFYCGGNKVRNDDHENGFCDDDDEDHDDDDDATSDATSGDYSSATSDCGSSVNSDDDDDDDSVHDDDDDDSVHDDDDSVHDDDDDSVHDDDDDSVHDDDVSLGHMDNEMLCVRHLFHACVKMHQTEDLDPDVRLFIAIHFSSDLDRSWIKNKLQEMFKQHTGFHDLLFKVLRQSTH